MKKFFIDFSGEEEEDTDAITESLYDGLPFPDLLIFRSDLDGALRIGNKIHALGYPVWLVKYKHNQSMLDHHRLIVFIFNRQGISSDVFFAAGVRFGPGVEINHRGLDPAFVRQKMEHDLETGRHFHVRVVISGGGQLEVDGSFDADPIQNVDIIDIKQWNTKWGERQ